MATMWSRDAASVNSSWLGMRWSQKFSRAALIALGLLHGRHVL
jgi:hypothetical protein